MFRLDGKVALVTGGSKGIGRAIAERMAEAGAKVVVASRKKEVCDEVVRAIHARGEDAHAIACNVSQLDQIAALVKGALDHYGRVDIFVGNAAVNPHYGPMTAIEEPAFDKIMDANVKANLWFAKLLLPAMAERKDGVFLVISSIAGQKGTDKIGVYGISKAADSALVRNLAVGWGKANIRVNAIAPGLIRTDFARALWEDPARRAAIEAAYPLGRIGEPDDVAGLAVFLAGQGGCYITGQTIVVDGGATIADVV